jgi:hypothetical protein
VTPGGSDVFEAVSCRKVIVPVEIAEGLLLSEHLEAIARVLLALTLAIADPVASRRSIVLRAILQSERIVPIEVGMCLLVRQQLEAFT